MKQTCWYPLNVLLLSALSFWISGSLANASPPSLSADEASDLRNASVQRLEEKESLDKKNGFDFSTLSGTENSGFAICSERYQPDHVTQSGHMIKMLGAAMVYESPSNGSAILGHVGERFAYCRDGQYFDALYDYAPFEASDFENDFDEIYGVQHASFTDEERKQILKSNFEHLYFDIAKQYNIDQTMGNRSIYEAWFDIDAQTMYSMMASNADRYADQMEKLQKHQPLPVYKLPSDDCVTPVAKDLELINPKYISKHSPARLTPSFLFNYVKDREVSRIIVYPSQRQFRILKKRAEGKTTALSWLLPASKDLSRGFGDSWALVYTQTHGLLKYVLVGPATGAANIAAAAAETVYGVVTEPIQLIGKLFRAKKTNSKKIGFHRILQGLDDLFDSGAEVFSFQIRFPLPDDWTHDEMDFFQSFSQQSLLLKYLGAKYENTPVIVNAPLN